MKDPFEKAAQPATQAMMQASADAARLQRIIDVISIADTGRRLISFLKERDIKIEFHDQLPQGGDTVGICVLNTERIGALTPYRFQLAKPVIHLLRGADEARAAMALIHEGRHAMQAENGQHPLCRYLAQEDFKTYVRATEADAGSFTILTALKIFVAQGGDAVLRHAVRTAADDSCTDSLLRLVKEYGPEVTEQPVFQRALFNAWFEDRPQVERYDQYGEHSWRALDKAVRDILGFTPDAPLLTADQLRPLGALSGGDNYLTLPDMADVGDVCGLKRSATSVQKKPSP